MTQVTDRTVHTGRCTQPTLREHLLASMSVPPVIPPFRFATVEAGRAVTGRSAEECGAESLYRSAYPSLRNYRFLLGLNLQTIISLIPSPEPVKDLAEFCDLNLITHMHFQVPRFRGLCRCVLRVAILGSRRIR